MTEPGTPVAQTLLDVLVIGSGGREHALARSLASDPGVGQVHVAPGNPGTIQFATNHPVDALDPAAVAALAVEVGVGLVVVGPEAPLVAGVADAVRDAGIACFGPSREAAQLEGSKAFAKDVMQAAGVPTADARVCTNPDEIAAALAEFGAPFVVKDDGLAAGKGVVVTHDHDEALAHGSACSQVVIEEFLDGPEVSLFVITDGITALPLQPAQDFKRVGDGDTGPNTGGMGAYSPLPWAPDDLVDEVLNTVARPTLEELQRRGISFQGLLYCGLALTSNGVRVVEFNARFGDPETQVLLALLKTPLGQLLHKAATGHLDEIGELTWHDQAAVGVVMAADGYPSTPSTGGTIALPADTDDAWTIHSGTGLDGQTLVAAGGRVLTVVGRGADLAQARGNAYAHVDAIDFATGFNRTDIAGAASGGEPPAPPTEASGGEDVASQASTEQRN